MEDAASNESVHTSVDAVKKEQSSFVCREDFSRLVCISSVAL